MKTLTMYLSAFLLISILIIRCDQKNNNIVENKENNTTVQNTSRNPEPRLDVANVFWNKKYTLFDLITDEPIFPNSKGGVTIYQIYYSSNEDPTPHFGEYTPEQLEKHLYYKFKNKENCIKFCDSK